MSEHKLKYKLAIVPEGSQYIVYFKVLQMDERFRLGNIEDERPHHDAANGFSVRSQNFPQLLPEVVYLWGIMKDEDQETVKYAFDSEDDAVEYVEQVHAALLDWSKNWVGFDPLAEATVFTV